MNKPTFKKLCLMYMQQLTNFPYIEKDFDALTDYGLLCKVVDYLNEVIKNNNIQNESITNLYNAFIEIKDYIDNYFDNLDVQDEINNKLDEMAENGELGEIVNRYLTPVINNFKDEVNNKIELQDAEILNIDKKVNSATSGSPLAASSISDMTDTSRIYVNTSNGYWYYYDGTNWVQGGIYQSTVNSNDLEKALNLSELNYNNTLNDLDNNNIELNFDWTLGSINAQGEEITSSHSYRTDFIKIIKTYSYNFNIILNAFIIRLYDENRNFLSSIFSPTSDESYNLNLFNLNNASYFRIVLNPNNNVISFSNLKVTLNTSIKEKNNIYENINNFDSGSMEIPFLLEKGSINTSGNDTTSTTNYRSNFIKIDSSSLIKIVTLNHNGTAIRLYDENKTFISIASGTSNTSDYNEVIKTFNAKYLRFVLNTENEQYEINPNNVKLYLINRNATKSNITINCLGDSFTQDYNNGWQKFLRNNLGVKTNGYGVSSSRISVDYTAPGGTLIKSFLNRYNTMNTNADMTIIFGGINDSVSIYGNIIPMGDINSPVDDTTFCGALKLLIEDIQLYMPGKLIMGVIPPQFEQQSWRIPILTQIQELERQIYKMYSIPYVDLPKICQEMAINDYNIRTYRKYNDNENYHPSELGYKAIARDISNGVLDLIKYI